MNDIAIDTTEPTVIILRGLPGSGKSTLVQSLVKDVYHSWAVCSADFFWIQKDGSYKFDANLVPENHHQCLRQFIQYMHNNSVYVIFVDNTNTAYDEFSHYIKIAEAYGYKVVVITLNVSVETSLARNTHNVPKKTIENMFLRFASCNIPRKYDNFVIDTETPLMLM
jgi:predicted kinase